MYSIMVGFSPVHDSVHQMLLPSENPFKCHAEVCICSLWSHLNVLTVLPMTGGCSEGLDAFKCFFKQNNAYTVGLEKVVLPLPPRKSKVPTTSVTPISGVPRNIRVLGTKWALK